MTPTPAPVEARLLRVVIADAATDLRTLLRQRLQRDGRFDVVAETADGLSAVDLVRRHRPDAIILDLAMPDPGGLSALEEIRETAPSTAVIAVSGFDTGETKPDALALGAAAYIERGAPLDEIASAVADACRLGDGTPDIPAIVPDPGRRPATPPDRILPQPGTRLGGSRSRRWRRRPPLRTLVVAFVLGGLGAGLWATQASTRRFIRDAFVERAALAAHLVGDELQREAERLASSAELVLADRLDPRDVAGVARGAGSPDIYMVLGADGRVAHLEPYSEGVAGTDIRDDYVHLARASSGEAYVSDMVSSVVRGEPLAALAVPFEGVDGTRVISVVVSPDALGLDDLVQSTIADFGGSIHLVDRQANLVTGLRERDGITALAAVDPLAAAAQGDALDGPQVRDGTLVTASRVPGTGWSVVATIPTVTLYRPLEGWFSSLPWIIVAALAALSVVIMSLVSRLTREREVLASANRDLERSNRDLEQFAYVASHDLQEPLRKVAGYCELLQRRYAGRLDADADEFIGYAVDGATRLQRLIADLLQFSRAGRDIDTTRLDVVDLADVMRQVSGDLEHRVADAGGRIVVPTTAPRVRGNADAIGQVLQNLVSNGLKFRTDEPPVVEISAAQHADVVTVTVTDNGIGIRPEDHERIFRIFHRLHPREAYPGTGIGLAVVRRIVERQGGRVWVCPVETGTDGGGACFRFTLSAADPGGTHGA